MSASADRSLLYGLIALQNQFIDQADLLAAFHAWSEDSSRPIAQVLRDRGALAEDEALLLDALVRKHLAKHNDDPARSLAALSSIGPAAEALLTRIPDPAIRASLGHLAPPRGDDSPFLTRTTDPDDPKPVGVRFRRLRPHASGNLGHVWVAHDKELHREVALKEIQDKHADVPSSRARFLVEAEITGGLEHPGIVPVYGLGTYSDGRPFYAMRFIKGDNLAGSIKAFHADESFQRDHGARNLALQKLLRRFLDVCNAIAYAHSRGILHRDLKPGNIMVGKYGETLVVDWGLAKTIGEPSINEHGESTLMPPSGSGMAETQAGTAVGTPAFMSPEQARGEVDKLGPASDVYSLGATLYELLTGRPSVSGRDLGEILGKVERGDIPPLRSVSAWVPRPLEAICLKAMAHKPADRYASPKLLAEDIEHWLADEPVSALPEGMTTKIARWTRRHKSATLAAAAALLAISLAATIAFLVVSRALEDRTQALLNEQTALTEQRKATDAATHAFESETRALARMRVNFEAARATVEDYVTIIRDDRQLRDAVLRPFRERMLGRALAYSEEFIRKYEAEPSLKVDVAEAYSQAGRLNHDMGRLVESGRAYERSLAIYSELSAARPGDAQFEMGVASISLSLGIEQRSAGRSADAERSYGRALGAFERLAATHPDEPKYQDSLARALANLGNLHSSAGRPADAESSLLRAVDVQERLVAAQPDVPLHREGLASVCMNLGAMQHKAGRFTDAERTYERALGAYERLAAAQPDVTSYQHGLATTCTGLGASLVAAGRPDDAVPRYLRALGVFERLAAAQPDDPKYQNLLGATLHNLAIVHHDAGRSDSARDLFLRAIEHQRRALGAFPQHPTYRTFYRNHLDALAQVELALRHPVEVADAVTKGREIDRSDPDKLYNHACYLSRCVPIAAGIRQDRERYAGLAVETLGMAVHAGWGDFAHTALDSDLEPLRDRPDFRALLLEMMDHAFPADPFEK